MPKMQIFPVLLICVLVSTSHFRASAQGLVDQSIVDGPDVTVLFIFSTMENFQALDTNGDKKVSTTEVEAAYKGWYGVEWAEEDILLAFDQDGDGELNVEEFSNYDEDGELMYFLKKMDHDSDGFLTRGEILDSLKLWGMSEEVSKRRVAEDFAEADVNNDDRWDLTEFNEWMSVISDKEDFIRDDFNAIDKDRNGFISVDEQKNWFI